MVRVERSVRVALVLVITLALGCNVYEGLYEEGDSDNAEILLQDARIALQQNRPEAAIQYLRKALETAEASSVLRKRIQIKLASAVLQVQGINMMTLSRMAQNLTRNSKAASVIATGKTTGQTCLFPPSHSRTLFDPLDGINLDVLNSPESQSALAESQVLVARVFTGDETSTAPVLPCDDEALDQAIASMQQQELTNGEIAEALVDYALSLSTVAYLDVIEAGGDDAQFFYVTPPAGDDYIGLCFASEQTCNASVGKVNDNLVGLDCSTRILQKRAALLESTSAQDLANLARDGFENMADGLANATCTAQ